MAANIIPKIDLGLNDNSFDRERIAGEIDNHCRDMGFFVLTGHGIPERIQQDVFEQAKRFFLQSDESKMQIAIDSSEVHRGYACVDSEQINPDGAIDYRETYLIGWERRDGTPLPERIPLLGPNKWPPNISGFRECMDLYYDSAFDVATKLLDCISLAITGAETNIFANFFKDSLTNLVLAHYPVAENQCDEISLGCGEHTDYGLITLLMHDGVPGLQVQARSGEWIDVDCKKGDLIVNLGDMLEFMSGGKYISNAHRVMIMRSEPRISVPFFVQPDYEVVIRPVVMPIEESDNRSRWKPRLAGAYIEERFSETFPKPIERLSRKIINLNSDQREAIRSCAQLLNLLSKEGPRDS